VYWLPAQACGDTHLKSFTTNYRKSRGGNRRRSYSENPSARDFPEEGLAYPAGANDAAYQPKWCYTFTRGGRVTWRTGIGSLLMLFLETYITFDYRRFGISIDHEGFVTLPGVAVRGTGFDPERCACAVCVGILQRVFSAPDGENGVDAILCCHPVRRGPDQTRAKHLQQLSYARGKIVTIALGSSQKSNQTRCH